MRRTGHPFSFLTQIACSSFIPKHIVGRTLFQPLTEGLREILQQWVFIIIFPISKHNINYIL